MQLLQQLQEVRESEHFLLESVERIQERLAVLQEQNDVVRRVGTDEDKQADEYSEWIVGVTADNTAERRRPDSSGSSGERSSSSEHLCGVSKFAAAVSMKTNACVAVKEFSVRQEECSHVGSSGGSDEGGKVYKLESPAGFVQCIMCANAGRHEEYKLFKRNMFTMHGAGLRCMFTSCCR